MQQRSATVHVTFAMDQAASSPPGGCHVSLLMLPNGSIIVYLMLALKAVTVSKIAIEDKISIMRWQAECSILYSELYWLEIIDMIHEQIRIITKSLCLGRSCSN